MTAKECRDMIEKVRICSLQNTHKLEMFEAILLNTPYINRQMAMIDLNRLFTQAKMYREEVNPQLEMMEEFLRRDEEMNGWKGEDREMEIYAE